MRAAGRAQRGEIQYGCRRRRCCSVQRPPEIGFGAARRLLGPHRPEITDAGQFGMAERPTARALAPRERRNPARKLVSCGHVVHLFRFYLSICTSFGRACRLREGFNGAWWLIDHYFQPAALARPTSWPRARRKLPARRAAFGFENHLWGADGPRDAQNAKFGPRPARTGLLLP